ncbi:cell division ATP-binding protein FtsE [Leucobacter sp. 1207-22]|uniref:cell division ATP-binding protein FtsE n=1 Tax=Leucobacter sp. 1207-22 TaxID=2604456 RepID=UPI004062BF00
MILFENVTKKYRGTQKPALDNLSINIGRGEFVFIVGASGSGKSSCLRLILCEDQPTSGSIHVAGQDLRRISSRKVPYFRRGLGMVFQDFQLLANKTVYDNVAFSLQVIGKSRGFIQEAVPDTLEMVGLAGKAKRYPHELSGGEQQRVAIARAIVNKPAILLADEPTGNLDPATSLGIMQLLKAINAAGTTVVMATHEAAFVDIMRQRVIELSQGVLVRDEVGGGYGETASIPIADLSTATAQALRAPEEVVRAALGPEADLDLASLATSAPGVNDTPLTPEAGQTEVGVPFNDADADTDLSMQPIVPAPTAATPPAAPVAGPADPPAVAQPLTLPDSDPLDDTIRAGAPGAPPAPRRRIPAFLEPEDSSIDPVQMAETGNLAEHLGLRDEDDQRDVGPVR